MLMPGTLANGVVESLTKFGAFIKLDDGSLGMVHISEISYSYVKDVADHLKVGQKVTVKVLKPNVQGKLNLSIKQAKESFDDIKQEENNQFESMLSRFMSDSSKKMSSLKMIDNQRKRPRR